MHLKHSVSVVIPAFNEEDSIKKCVEGLKEELDALKIEYEIIVVNDGSSDKTATILDALALRVSALKPIHLPINRGLGQALRSGFQAAEKPLIFYTDADLPIDFNELSRAIRILDLKEADIISGFRHDRTSEGMIRILYSFFYNILIRLLFRVKIRDINFSFKLMRSQLVKDLDLSSVGSFIDAELIIKATRKNAFVCQIGIDYFKRLKGSSTLSGPKVIFQIFSELFAFLIKK